VAKRKHYMLMILSQKWCRRRDNFLNEYYFIRTFCIIKSRSSFCARQLSASTAFRPSISGLATKRLTSTLNDIIQGVSEISALILTGNRTHQKEQLFSLPFWRKTLRNGLKN
jgi:hypothetical protein